jgi:peptide-methionine (S)-S-oxide reductase
MADVGFAKDAASNPKQLQKATFAGGCFWCMQPFFDRTKGVQQTMVGYTGGQTLNPTYQQVSSGKTGHAEAIEIIYDSEQVSYEKLLNIYWRNIDPTAKNQQFADHGTQYRSAIFYHDDEQKRIAEDSRKQLEASGKFKKPIVTEIVPASQFYPAEEHHQKYYQKNSIQYEMYHESSGRNQFFEKFWGKKAH